jgi:hypothetical protein
VLFQIAIGQVWKRGREYFHVPLEEEELGKHHWRVVRCVPARSGYQWVFPQEEEDQPVWELADFQEAELVSNRPE